MDKCREEFEAWFKEYCEENGIQCYLKVMDIGCYLSSFTDTCFESWKASRESMNAIKLPKALNICSESSRDRAISECKDAITSAGYKVE